MPRRGPGRDVGVGRHPSIALFLAAAAATGAGTGMLFTTGLALAAGAAVPASRAGVLSVFFVVAHLGMGGPSVAYGLLVGGLGSTTTIVVVSGVLAAVALAGAALVRGRPEHLEAGEPVR